MNRLRLILRGALYHRRAHLGVLAGTLLAAAVLTGALLVGDSVKFSLVRTASLRLGGMSCAVATGNRFFRQDLENRLGTVGGVEAGAALLLRGVVLRQDDAGGAERQVNNVQVIGMGRGFAGPGPVPSRGAAAINAKLAAQLGLRPGDRISVRVEKPSLLPRDAPLASRRGDDTVRSALVVESIMPDDRLGRFSLAANQVAPFNLFVNLEWLQETAGLAGKANLLVSRETNRTLPELNAALAAAWRIGDAGLVFREAKSGGVAPPSAGKGPFLQDGRDEARPSMLATNDVSRRWRATVPRGRPASSLGAGDGGFFQLESERIFMDPTVSEAALAATAPGPSSPAVGCLTYLVNAIDTVGATNRPGVPYSFVMAQSPSADRRLGVVPLGMADDEIILGRWLADRLSANTGAVVRMAYYELTPSGAFAERSRDFRVRGVVEMAEIAGEKEGGPKFPGLTDADRCADWEIGLPLDEDKVKDKANEDYWKEYRATPKAFVTLQAGREMWASRFGDLTAVRYPPGSEQASELAEALRERLDPAALGLAFLPVAETARKAAAEAEDFGGLFLGMSVFLVASALMLTGLLFAFGVQQRSGEIGLLLAVGYSPGTVRRLLLAEGCVVAALGSLAGAALGAFYTQALLRALATFWQGAVAGAAIQYHAEPMTVWTGAALGFACAVAALLLAIRRQVRKPARALLAGDEVWADGAAGLALRRTGLYLSLAGVAAALAIVARAAATGAQEAVPAFFAAGALLLVSGLGLFRELLAWLGAGGGKLTIGSLGLRHAGRTRGRSLAAAALLACGCFIVFAVSSTQEDPAADAGSRSSGAGGFALYGESTLPVQEDPGSPEGRRKLKLDLEPGLGGVSIVALKVRDGDDASCLNLNRAQSPRLLGVDPRALSSLGAFRAAGGPDPWQLLETTLPDGSVPGLAGDLNTAQWGLKMKTGPAGDSLIYLDERGQSFKVRLVGALPVRLSVFQGSVLLKAADFSAKFPSESGYRAFLADAPPGVARGVGDILGRRLDKSGVDLVPAAERLREFAAVESTYRAMFLVLGGLGLLLGSVGMGVVVLRNILERRGELALLRAFGYAPARVRRVILAEHWLLVGAGLALGLLASLAALWPALQSPSGIPYRLLFFFTAGVALFQLAWIDLCARLALRAPPLEALRSE